MKYELPKLPYEYNALEPHIDELTMHIHHKKHHATYIDNLNNSLRNYSDLQEKSLIELLTNISELPENIQTAVRNNGGGHYNHTFFWESLTPNYKEPFGNLKEAIESEFGNFESFKEKFETAAKTRFGSGWTWLLISDGKLEVESTPNQDSPVMEGKIPLLGLDVWEHAYYLKYQNKRAEYISAYWNIVNWEKAEEIYNKNK